MAPDGAQSLILEDSDADHLAWVEAAFVAGKYLSPRLFVSYGIGLFQNERALRVRYLLSRRWTIEAESGQATGTDILYRIERGRPKRDAAR